LPRHSVHLLCWNHARYLPQAIGSLLAQTERDFEVVFLDNRSTDGSAEVAARLLSYGGLRHKLLLNEEPANVATNINRLFAASTAPLTSFLSGDDWYAPRYVEAMLEAADKHRNAGLFYAGGFIYHQASGKLQPVATERHLSGDLYLALLQRREPMFFVGTCVRRDAFAAVGGFDEGLQVEDLDFFVRLARRFPIQRVDEPLVYYRRSDGAVSSNIRWMVEGWEQFHAKHRHAEGADMGWWMAETYRTYAAAAVDGGQFPLARQLLVRSLRLRPLSADAWRTAAYLLRRGLKRPAGSGTA
jgi:glycosyltransferase involved in cell wall biosynthesis